MSRRIDRMRRGVIAAVVAAVAASSLAVLAGPAQARTATDGFGYRVTDNTETGGPNFNFVDISTTGTNLNLDCDDCSRPVTMPFQFNFYGTSSDQLNISSNGWMLFNDAESHNASEYSNNPLPASSSDLGTSGATLAILPFWEDLYARNASPGRVYVETRGASPSRQYIVQWHQLPLCCTATAGHATFQAILFEGSNDILFQYADTTFNSGSYANDGAGATVGINKDAAMALQYSYAEPVITAGRAILFTMQQSANNVAVQRTAGADRYETSLAVSKRNFSSASEAVLVGGRDKHIVDSMTAAPLAKKLGGPVLLWDGANGDALTSELRRLGVQQVTLVGGEAAVPAAPAGFASRRVSGLDRYATAAAVAREVGGATGDAIVVNGENGKLTEALAAAGVAAGHGAPVVLTMVDELPAASKAVLAELNVSHTFVVGGEDRVSEAVVRQLPGAHRTVGSDVFETAARFAQLGIQQFHLPVFQVEIVSADAAHLVDGLSAAALGVPVLLSLVEDLPLPSSQFLTGYASSGMQRVELVGGPAALSREVEIEASRAVS